MYLYDKLISLPMNFIRMFSIYSTNFNVYNSFINKEVNHERKTYL